MEKGLREFNPPVGRGRYMLPGRLRGGHQRGLVPRLTKLPWIPTEQQWAGWAVASRRATCWPALPFGHVAGRGLRLRVRSREFGR